MRYEVKIFLSGLAGEDKAAPNLPTHTRPQARVRLGACGVWTLTEASVDCRVMSVATAAGAEASETE